MKMWLVIDGRTNTELARYKDGKTARDVAELMIEEEGIDAYASEEEI